MTQLKARLTDGGEVRFYGEPIASGGEKIVFSTRDHQHVVAFFYGSLDDRLERRRRLDKIIGSYNPTLSGALAEYWRKYFCWPLGVIDSDPALSGAFLLRHNLVAPALGIVVPAYRSNFFFRDRTGVIREKKGRWFTGIKARQQVPDAEKGNLLHYIQACTIVARAVCRLHNAGLAHSDLSHNNVLVDPKNGDACVLDIDSLVVPGVAPPTVLGTPGYMAPEVVAGIAQPSIGTDLHALAVLFYEALLLRHPLEGPKIRHTGSTEADAHLEMGAQALYIEHPTDRSNHLKIPPPFPVSRLGPYLEKMFQKTFVYGLHAPHLRATAQDWEKALSNTLDLLHPSPGADQWFVLKPGMPMHCPHSGRRLSIQVPYAEFYRRTNEATFVHEHRSLTIWNNLPLHRWHLCTNLSPRETERTPQAYFSFYQGRWWLVNQSGDKMRVLSGPEIPSGHAVELKPGLRLLLSPHPNGRLAVFEFMKPS